MLDMINKHFNDCYFSDSDGYWESNHVFIDGNNIDSVISDRDELYVGETGFGSGLNLMVLEDRLIKNGKKNFSLTYTTVELYPLKLDEVKELVAPLAGVRKGSLEQHILMYKVLENEIKSGWNTVHFQREWGDLCLNIFIGDIIESFIYYPTKNDVWFLDGHSPDKNPQMWNLMVFGLIAGSSNDRATFATFTAAGLVKRGLRSAGFFVKRKKGYGKKRHMIVGYLE